MTELRPRPTRRMRRQARTVSHATTLAWGIGAYFSAMYDGWADALFIGLCVVMVLTWIFRWELWRAEEDRRAADNARRSERKVMGAVTEVADQLADMQRRLQLIDVDTAYYEITAGLRELGN